MALDRHADDVDLVIILRVLRLNLRVIDGHLVDIHGCWPVCHGYLVGDLRADLREDGVVLNSDSQTRVHELLN